MPGYRIDTMSTNSSGSADTLRLTSYRKGTRCAGILLRFQYPVDNGASYLNGTYTIKDLVAAAIGSLTIRYGPNGEKVPYGTVGGVEMRDVHRYVTRAELPFSLPTTVSASVTARFDLFVPFAVRSAEDGRRRCPGWSQMQTVIIDLVEGSALNKGSAGNTAVRTPGGKLIVDVDVLTMPSEEDVWVETLAYFRANSATLEAKGPDGLLLALWDINAPFATNAFGLVSLRVAGETQYEAIPPYIIDDQYLDFYVDQGGALIDDNVTLLHTAEDQQHTNDMPCGDVVFKQAQQYVAQLQLRGLYWPVMDEGGAKLGIQAAANSHSQPVLGHVHDDVHKAPAAHARTYPMVIKPANHSEFTLREGLLAVPGGTEPTASIPAHRIASLNASVEHAGSAGIESASSAKAKATETLARSIPGALAHAVGGNGSGGSGKAMGAGLSRLSVPNIGAIKAAIASLL
jgi:hypothetical protein